MSAASTDSISIRPARRVRGAIRLPGDKSISHRYAILAALAAGRSRITGFSPGDDCAATLDCLAALGTPVMCEGRGPGVTGLTVTIDGSATRDGMPPPSRILDARNSGTTMRLLAGVVASHPFATTITGDASLRRRPMRRIIAPLAAMGAAIESAEGRAPLHIRGGRLRGIVHVPEVPSAQIKSGVLLAGLRAEGVTVVEEQAATRNHTELALTAFGATVGVEGRRVSIEGGQSLQAQHVHVPGDISAAAFWAVAAAAVPGSQIDFDDVGLNPTRTLLLDVLRRAGAEVSVVDGVEHAGELRGRLRVRHASVRSLTIAPDEVPGLIDELPVLAAWATHGGEIRVTGAAELRAKESDRITALVAGLRALGATAEEWSDGFHVVGDRQLSGGAADAAGDHRLAMAFAIAALGASGPSTIRGADAVQISYPGFFDVLVSVTE